MTTVRRETVSLTADAYGDAEDDVTVKRAPATHRWAGLFGVRVSDTDDASVVNDRRLTVVVREIDANDDDDYDDDDEFLGRIIFGKFDPRFDTTYYPRVFSVDDNGVAGSDENALEHITTTKVRVEVTGATPLSEVDVDVYWMTSGDYRF